MSGGKRFLSKNSIFLKDSEISSLTLWSASGKNLLFHSSWVCNYFMKNHPNGLEITAKKYHRSPSTYQCFSFFWCSHEGKSRIFQIMVLLQF